MSATSKLRGRVIPLLGIASALLLSAGIVSVRTTSHDKGTSAQVLGEQLYAAQKTDAKPDKSSSKFSATGSVDGLYPGATIPLTLTLINNTGATIEVTSLTVAVANASSSCVASNLVVGAFDGPVTVPKKGSAPTVIPITMRTQAPNACQGATFSLTYSGDASPT
jgi:hypothetical protein